MYKTVTYFTKTNRPHEVSITKYRQYKMGCSNNSAQGTRRFTAIATTYEIETRNRERQNDKPAIRKYEKNIFIPNRHQRKHGITEAGF